MRVSSGSVIGSQYPARRGISSALPPRRRRHRASAASATAARYSSVYLPHGGRPSDSAWVGRGGNGDTHHESLAPSHAGATSGTGGGVLHRAPRARANAAVGSFAIEAGLNGPAAAEVYLASGLAPRCVRVLFGPPEAAPARAMATVDALDNAALVRAARAVLAAGH